jgi:hypothetical protein
MHLCQIPTPCKSLIHAAMGEALARIRAREARDMIGRPRYKAADQCFGIRK